MAAANLSQRYIADRFLPDKAIDLMDEATSRLAMELESVPSEIDVVQRRLVQLELADRQLADETEEHAQQRRERSRRRRSPSCARSWPTCASSGSWKRAGWATCSDIRKQLMDVELQYNQLAAAIKEKQSAASSFREDDYQKLYELDLQQKAAGRASWRSSNRTPARQPANGTRRLLAQGGRPGGDRRGRQRVDRHSRLAA